MSTKCAACNWPVRTFRQWFTEPCFAAKWTPQQQGGHELTSLEWIMLPLEEEDGEHRTRQYHHPLDL